MSNILEDMKKEHDFLVCVDSDGCVFDNMELKHKECFCPATVNIWGLQGVSRYARECWDFVNLYSTTRGINRFPGIVRTLELLDGRPEARARGYRCPDLTPLKEWIASTDALSAVAIKKYAEEHPDMPEVLKKAALWSEEVNGNVEHIVHGIVPFPSVKETLCHLRTFADVVVVSAASHDALSREWESCGLIDYVTVVAGQELGNKAECIRKAMGTRYEKNHVLKIGDAPGDYDAAKQNGVLFSPIIPGKEDESWRRILERDADLFRNLEYAGDAMDGNLKDFFSVLLDTPPWDTGKKESER